ncbi:MAG: CPBP family intramembrane glutamic endopeptidase [Myxococcota bacterium]
MDDPTLAEHVLAGLIGAFALFNLVRGQSLGHEESFDTKAKLAIYWINGAIMLAAAGATCAVWASAGRSFASLGLTWQQAERGTGLAIAAAFVGWIAFETWRGACTAAKRIETLGRLRKEVPFLPATLREARHFSVFGASAGLTEEIIARGFAISYLLVFTGSSPAGLVAVVLLPAFGFAAIHRYQGWRAMAKIFVLSVFFGSIFVVTESLLLPILLHALLDVFGGWMAWWLTLATHRPSAAGSA